MPVVPRTTLVAIDCRYPALAARALARSLKQCTYERTLLLTDAAEVPGLPPQAEQVRIARIPGAEAYSEFMLKKLVDHIDTDYVQVVQWDGWVIDGSAWQERFFEYDYIGARWWYFEPPHDVGNGGFSFRSRRLLEVVREVVPVGHPEDGHICITHRALLEQHGIRFAPGEVADAYSFENSWPSGREFGFHRLFNFPFLMAAEELTEHVAHLLDSDLCTPAAHALVRYLAHLGRSEEALQHARRVLRHREGMPAEMCAELDRYLADPRPEVFHQG